MEIEQTTLTDVLVLRPRRFADDRGFFQETWNREALKAAGIDLDFVQDNHSLSVQTGTVRGLHFQRPPRAQDKLVRVVRGRILDVAVDARRDSLQFGKWVGVELTADNAWQLLVPKGFLHGFITLEPDTEVLYKCTDTYAPDCDGSVFFADPELAIDWGLPPEQAILSDKDRKAQSWADLDTPFSLKD